MITSDYGRSASDTPHPRTPAAQLQLDCGQRDVVRIGAVQVPAYVHTTSPHRRCAQVPTPVTIRKSRGGHAGERRDRFSVVTP